jgi:hypothetical protein
MLLPGIKRNSRIETLSPIGDKVAIQAKRWHRPKSPLSPTMLAKARSSERSKGRGQIALFEIRFWGTRFLGFLAAAQSGSRISLLMHCLAVALES